jgi:hypothetical protein
MVMGQLNFEILDSRVKRNKIASKEPSKLPNKAGGYLFKLWMRKHITRRTQRIQYKFQES